MRGGVGSSQKVRDPAQGRVPRKLPRGVDVPPRPDVFRFDCVTFQPSRRSIEHLAHIHPASIRDRSNRLGNEGHCGPQQDDVRACTSSGLPKSIKRPAPIHQTQELPRSALSAQRDGRPYVRRAQKLSNLIFGGAVGRRAPTVDANIDTVSRDRADGQHYAPAHESDEALKDQLRELSRTTAPAKTSHALHTRLRTSSRPERSRTARRIHSVLHTSASRTGPLPEPYHMFAAGGSAAAWSHS
jgi:hypothetical protein